MSLFCVHLHFRHRNQFSLDVSAGTSCARSPLTFLWPGVVFSKGMVLVNIWIQKLQGILWNIFSGHDFIIANNVRESNSGKFFLCVGFNRMEVRF
ncbi:hypothetical protein G4228_005628 [Cervus hanglu yarkandensis]|nr:hypothetical protein G4228_005628 [Cervus hanglu yarkandensis]